MQPDILTINDHITACLGEVHPAVSRYSRPLFAVDRRDRPDLFASCIILASEAATYLVTAAHALHEIQRADSSIHLGGKEIRVIEGRAVRSSIDGTDPFDIATIRLDEAFAASHGLEALPIEKTVVGRSFRNPHMHCMHGYPCTKNKTVKAADTDCKVYTTYAFTYAGVTPEGVDFGRFNKNTSDHLCVSYDTGIDADGNTVKPPKPKGMSGGGLWVVPNSFRGTEVYLAGILIEQHGKIVFATKIDRVIELIQKGA